MSLQPIVKAAILRYDIDVDEVIEEAKYSGSSSAWSCLSLETDGLGEDMSRREVADNPLVRYSGIRAVNF